MSNPIVIGFYPGGGGNRYYRMVNGLDYTTENATYDGLVNQDSSHRYLLGDIAEIKSDVILTHCLNYTKIKEVFSPREIIFIQTDFKNSLCREWVLGGRSRYLKNCTHDHEWMIIGYNNIKAPSWPVCETYQDFENLPTPYKEEVFQTTQNTAPPVDLLSAFATIVWHHEYYANYPNEVGDATITDNPEFDHIMTAELTRYNNEIFNFCWLQYQLHGKEAPIVDIYNETIR